MSKRRAIKVKKIYTFKCLASRRQVARVAKRAVIGSLVAEMSSDFSVCPPDILRPVIGQFSSGHSQTIENISPLRFLLV